MLERSEFKTATVVIVTALDASAEPIVTVFEVSRTVSVMAPEVSI